MEHSCFFEEIRLYSNCFDIIRVQALCWIKPNVPATPGPGATLFVAGKPKNFAKSTTVCQYAHDLWNISLSLKSIEQEPCPLPAQISSLFSISLNNIKKSYTLNSFEIIREYLH